jgi:hypothetical protein
MASQIARPQGISTQSTTVAFKPPTSHLLYIDNLRTTLITFVILLNLAITYGVQGGWYYSEASESSTANFVIMMFLTAIGSRRLCWRSSALCYSQIQIKEKKK